MSDINEVSDARLDDLLREQFRGPVADEGFAARVMLALPPRREYRRWLLPGAAALGGLLAWVTLMPSPVWQQAVQEWLAGDFGAATAGIGVLMFGVTLASFAWSLEEA